jgi:menaquinol-cytochrome c reductase iron-sulfur subunit
MAETDTRPAEKSRRRSFLEIAIWTISALVGLALSIPFLAALVGSAARRKEQEYAEVAALESLPLGRPVDVPFTQEFRDGFIRGKTVRRAWLVRTSASEVSAFSPLCPHLGCRFDWDARTAEFKCPCHASAYGLDGRVLAGPAPRPLDLLPIEIRQGRVFVKWQQFRAGTPKKILA